MLISTIVSGPFKHSTCRTRSGRALASLAVLLILCAAGPACRAEDGPDLVYHEIGADGAVVESRKADLLFNPASTMKIATTLWVLDTLGPEHRFVTRFGYRGTFDRQRGAIEGDLIVHGGADPDFHVENAYLIARELNRLGIRRVTGRVRVDDRFWIGWEGGSERREPDPGLRATKMAERLRAALDPSAWNEATRRGIEEFRERRGIGDAALPAVAIAGGAGRDTSSETGPDTGVTWVAEHRSNPVVLTLKRFNAFSNNDIERFEVSVGDASGLAATLTERLGLGPEDVRVATLSGLGSNRLDARAVVALLEALRATCKRLGIEAGDVLPVLGCDPGTLENFPRLDDDAFRGALVAKTGSLNETDGGVAVLAGILDTRKGDRLFCVATPKAGGRLPAARAAQESWLLDRIAAAGGPRTAACPAALPFSDSDATVAGTGPTTSAGTP